MLYCFLPDRFDRVSRSRLPAQSFVQRGCVSWVVVRASWSMYERLIGIMNLSLSFSSFLSLFTLFFVWSFSSNFLDMYFCLINFNLNFIHWQVRSICFTMEMSLKKTFAAININEHAFILILDLKKKHLENSSSRRLTCIWIFLFVWLSDCRVQFCYCPSFEYIHVFKCGHAETCI